MVAGLRLRALVSGGPTAGTELRIDRQVLATVQAIREDYVLMAAERTKVGLQGDLLFAFLTLLLDFL